MPKPSAKTKARPKRRPPPQKPKAHDAALFYDDDDDDGSETDAFDSIELESALKRVLEEKSALIEKKVAQREKKVKAKYEAFAKQAYDKFKAECKAYDDENAAEAAKLDKQVRELLAQKDIVAAKSAKRIKAVIQKVEHFSHGLRKEVEKAHSSVEGARGAYDAVIGEYDSAMASKLAILQADVAASKKRRLDQTPVINAIEGILARGKLMSA